MEQERIEIRRGVLVTPKLGGTLLSVAGVNDFGYTSYETSALPSRLWEGMDSASRPEQGSQKFNEEELSALPSPAATMAAYSGESGNTLPEESRRSVTSLLAAWILSEDRHRVFDAHLVDPLAHQLSLVEHVLSLPNLRRVLIADEVGLGKTVEAGLIIKRLLAADETIKTLYLTEARLVGNVAQEFRRLELRPRVWRTGDERATLDAGESDPLVIASMHLAAANDARRTLVAHSGPWDVIVVDEAHHLSDYSPDGSDPRRRMALVRQLIENRLTHNGRVIFLSGTPHQGNQNRFQNLLRLLSDDGRTVRQSAGRIIYRTKEDVTDWDGCPLFPPRDVRSPIAADVGHDYLQWMEEVRLMFDGGDSASAWRRAQALQWCASSPQAGLAYLVRHALRSGHRVGTMKGLAEALQVLSPYRGGPATESNDALIRRMVPEASQLDLDETDDDNPDVDAEDHDVDPAVLTEVLEKGVGLIRGDAFGKKLAAVFHLFDSAPEERFVVFAQPVDTVFALRDRIERQYGPGTVAMIVGSQEDEVRRGEIERFVRGSGPCRFLVSSRAGGEGINLQASNRLVHFDVPWNPMELEQRVGRVHRYGSTRTIIVDTVVLKGSREERVLKRARAKLALIAGDLADRDQNPEAFERLFARTMGSVPWEELSGLMMAEGFGDLTTEDEQRIVDLTRQGLSTWRQFDGEFRRTRANLEALTPGNATQGDVETLALRLPGLDLQQESGWRTGTFVGTHATAAYVEGDRDDFVLRSPSGPLTFSRHKGIGLRRAASLNERVEHVGLNSVRIAAAIRTAFGVGDRGGNYLAGYYSGIGAYRVAPETYAAMQDAGQNRPLLSREGAVLYAMWVREVERRRWEERTTKLESWVIPCEDPQLAFECSGEEVASLVRYLASSNPIPRLSGARPRPEVAKKADEITRLASRSFPDQPVRVLFPLWAIWLLPPA